MPSLQKHSALFFCAHLQMKARYYEQSLQFKGILVMVVQAIMPASQMN